MIKLNPYLTFDGKCEEAMNFYKECFGGELNIMKVGESEMQGDVTDKEKNLVMHSSLISDNVMFFASDMIMGDKVSHGNDMAICLNFENKEDADPIYEKLSEGGTADHPLRVEFWGDVYGDLHDKYGFRWMFNVSKTVSK